MYNIKNSIFSNLTKNQKASLLRFLRSFTKNNQTLGEERILYEFLEEEEYYYKIEQPHLHFVVENIEDEEFLRDLKKYIAFVLEEIEYKKAQKPIIEKHKELLKEKRKQAQEFKMKREKPTLKQLKYYTSLCKNHNIEMKDTQNASRLDLKNWISEILDKNE